MGSKYKQSPIGIGRHCWINQPDTKYVADGLYHYDHILEGQEAEAFKAEIDAEVNRAYDEEVAREKLANPKFNAKPWSKYFPYDVEVDDDKGEPTGRIAFKFKQNAKIKLKDNSVKPFQMGVRDSHNKPTDAKVYGGATVRALYSCRNVKLATQKQFGVRLDFCMVQLLKLAPMTGGGFDEVDDSYVDDSDSNQGGTPQPQEDAPY